MRLLFHIFPKAPFVLPSGAMLNLADDALRADVLAELKRSVKERAVPILRQHEQNGDVYGRVVDVVEKDDGLYAVAEPGAELMDLYRRGKIEWASAFYARGLKSDLAGRPDFRHAVVETSFVSIPHFQTGQTPIHHEAMSAVASGWVLQAALSSEENMADKQPINPDAIASLEQAAMEIRGMVESMGERMSALEARVEAMAAPPKEDEEPPADGEPAPSGGKPAADGDDDEEKMALRKRIATLEVDALCAKHNAGSFRSEIMAIHAASGAKAAEAMAAKLGAPAKADPADRFNGRMTPNAGTAPTGPKYESAHAMAMALESDPSFKGTDYPTRLRHALANFKEA